MHGFLLAWYQYLVQSINCQILNLYFHFAKLWRSNNSFSQGVPKQETELDDGGILIDFGNLNILKSKRWKSEISKNKQLRLNQAKFRQIMKYV